MAKKKTLTPNQRIDGLRKYNVVAGFLHFFNLDLEPLVLFYQAIFLLLALIDVSLASLYYAVQVKQVLLQRHKPHIRQLLQLDYIVSVSFRFVNIALQLFLKIDYVNSFTISTSFSATVF